MRRGELGLWARAGQAEEEEDACEAKERTLGKSTEGRHASGTN